jgi:hypothetical protein
MTGVDDRAVSRRDMIAREAVLLPGDPSLREIVAALTPTGLDLLELPIEIWWQRLAVISAASGDRGRCSSQAMKRRFLASVREGLSAVSRPLTRD